jgi:signal transduction histidine kinase
MAHGRPVRDSESTPGSQRGVPDPEIGNFLLRTSHDLRSSLRAIRVHAELLAKRLEAGNTSDFDHHVSVIVADSSKLELLADGLAAYSIACQVDQSSFVVAPLEVMLRTQLAKLGQQLRENGAVVTYDPLPRIYGDPDWLRQLFEHLLRNALLHRGPAAPRIHISAEKQEQSWLFSVRDNGPGIESEYLERIFQPFERLRGQQSPGPGLGLAICRKIVERHGGRIWAESKPGSGSTFFFSLPAEPR